MAPLAVMMDLQSQAGKSNACPEFDGFAHLHNEE